jgi:hypothetical protein
MKNHGFTLLNELWIRDKNKFRMKFFYIIAIGFFCLAIFVFTEQKNEIDLATAIGFLSLSLMMAIYQFRELDYIDLNHRKFVHRGFFRKQELHFDNIAYLKRKTVIVNRTYKPQKYSQTEYDSTYYGECVEAHCHDKSKNFRVSGIYKSIAECESALKWISKISSVKSFETE